MRQDSPISPLELGHMYYYILMGRSFERVKIKVYVGEGKTGYRELTRPSTEAATAYDMKTATGNSGLGNTQQQKRRRKESISH